ncbi:MAG: MATE family efflux transporter [Lawsonibacter sp.]|nr:MATE family efflux transporter [Lawsonibacter sp.]
MNTTALTQGPIRRQLIALALPMLAGNIMQQLYNTVDAVLVGRIVGESAFAALGVAGAVMNLFLFLISGGCSGVGVLLSQLYGAEDGPAFRRDFFLAALFGLLLSLGLTGAGLLLLDPLLSLLQTPESVCLYAHPYLTVIFLGFPAAFSYQLSAAVLWAVGNTQAALLFLMVSMAVNLGLDLALIPYLDVAGAAWATVVSQALATGLCLGYLARRFPQLMFHRGDMRYDGPLLRRTAHYSFVSALHMASLYIGKLAVQRTVNGLGEASIAAYTAATRIEGFANSFGDSGASAMAVFIGQNTGAGDRERVFQGLRQGRRLLAWFGVAVSLGMILAASPLLSLVLPGQGGDSLDAAAGYLRLVACFYLFNFLGSALAGFFEGLGRVNLTVIGAAGHITFRAVVSWLLAPALGLPAVALATGLGWVGVVTFWSVLARAWSRSGNANHSHRCTVPSGETGRIPS